MLNRNLVIVFCCFGVILLGLIGMTIQHEMAHKEFFKYFGVKSEIHLNWFGIAGGYTLPNVTDLNNLSEEDLRAVTMLNSINEIYWYPFLIMYAVISSFFILCMIFFIKIWSQPQ